MTENNTAMDSGAEGTEYLYEPFVTDDGIEVPPPTRPMGPRRLTRYRDEVAKYLRAIRDGELTEEPPANMPQLPEEGGISEEQLQVQRRFAALSVQGGIQSADEKDDLLLSGENDTREDVAVIKESEPGIIGQPVSGGLFREPEDKDATTEFLVSGDVIVEETSGSAERVEDSEGKEDTRAAEEFSPAIPDSFEADASTVEPPFYLSTRPIPIASSQLPKPVSALDSEGLDLTPLDRLDEENLAVEDEGNQFTPQSFSSVHYDSSRDVLAANDHAKSNEVSSTPPEEHPEKAVEKRNIFEAPSEENSDSSSRSLTWIIALVVLIAIIALVLIFTL